MNPRLFHRLAAFFRGDKFDQELSVEISTHLQLAIDENLRRGMSPDEARRQALIQFGGRQQALESAREQRSLPFLEAFLQDARFSLRLLAKSPAFTFVAVFTLALGIGATTSIFSVVYGVLLRPLPYRNAQQIVRVWEQNSSGGRMNVADPNFTDMRTQAQSLSSLAEFNSDIVSVSGRGEPTRTPVASVSAEFLEVMGAEPIFGRAFVPEEQRLDAPLAVLVSYSFWQQDLGATQDLSSAALKVGNQPASVVGVLPAGFHFPDHAEIWIPRERYQMLPSRSAHNWNAIGRLQDGATVAQARSDLTTIAQRLKQQFGQDTAMAAVAVEPLREAMTSDVRPALLVLLVASGFLLLIACANVTNLMLAQASGRERELAIRSALGAQRYRLLRQFLTEALLLSMIGGVLGVLLACWGLNGLLALAPENLPRLADVSLNLPVLFFSLSLVFLVSIALAVFTSLRSVSPDSRDALQGGTRGGIGTIKKQRIGRLLAAAQLATALVLLVGATLLGRSLLRVLSVNSGFRTDGIVSMDLAMPDDSTKTARVEFFEQLFAQLRQIPGVQEVGGTNNLPLSHSGFADGSFVVMNAGQLSQQTRDLIQRSVDSDFQKDPALLAELTTWFEGLFHNKPDLGYADYIVASDGFFKTLDIPLLKGRMFDARDTIDAPHVALISQSAVNDRWPGQDPLGRTIEFGNMDGDARLLTIVGVVGDVRDHSLEAAAVPTVYVDYRQRPLGTRRFTVVIRTAGQPDAIIASARAIVRGLNPDLPPRFRTLSQVYSASLDARRFSLTLVGIFSVAAFLLALAGVYGVISYSVAQRTREIGVRMALGANTFQVLGMVLKQGAFTGVIGICAGLLGSFALTRLLQSQLFEVSPTDPLTLLGVSLVLLLVSLAACWIPGRRAARIDPIIALRCE